MRKMLMLCAMLSLTACASKRPIVQIPPASCARLVPKVWQEGVEAAPVPANTPLAEWLGKPLTQALAAAIVAPWAGGYVAMSGQLEKANGRTVDAIGIVATCEAMVNEARP